MTDWYPEQQPATQNLNASWRMRFDFFNAYGLPNSSPAAKAAYRALPFGTKLRLQSNILAFLFGPIYFFVKGMWQKGLTLLLIAFAAGAVMGLLGASDSVFRAVGIGIACAAMSTANYAYYLHVTRRSQSWNPFEGMGRQR